MWKEKSGKTTRRRWSHTSHCFALKRSTAHMCHTNTLSSLHSSSDAASALRASSHFNKARPIFLACHPLWESCKLFPQPEHLHFERRGPVRDESPRLFLDPGPSMGIDSPQALKCARNYYVCFLALRSRSLPCTRPEFFTAKTAAWLPNVV